MTSRFVVRESDGFTLAEMLASLVITSVMAGMLLGFLSQTKLVERQHARREAQLELELTGKYIADLISGARKLPLMQRNATSGVESNRYLTGSHDSLMFVSLVSTGFQKNGLRDVRIFQKKDEIDFKIVEERSFRRNEIDRHAEMFVLNDNNIEISFRYRAEIGALETEDWAEIGTLPYSVTITLNQRFQDRPLVVRHLAFPQP